MKKICFIACLLFATLNTNAQSNLGCYYDSLMINMICGNMTIQGDPDNICDDGVHLWVDFTPGSSFNPAIIQEAFGSTDSYKVVQPPFIFESQTMPISANIVTDDIWSQVVPLPFKFCFFENKYDSILIGANGQISFDLSLAGLFNGYSTIGWPPLPYNNSAVNNAIFCPYHDITPAAGGTISYSVEGIAPCRKFIVTWDNIPMYDCLSMTATQQIVLTEGSYRIDVNLINKPVCPIWLSGVAYMGIQNAIGTIAFTPPGYNGGAWTAANESWSFIPIGNGNISTDTGSITQGLYWVDSVTNNIIGFGDTLHYWPSQDTTIYVFFGDTTLLNDSCFIAGMDTCINACGKGFCCNSTNPYIRLHYYKPDASFTFSMNSTCVGADVQFINTSVGTTSYYWDFGDGATDTQPNPMHSYTGLGPFNVMMVGFGLGCNDTAYTTITPTIVPVVAAFTLSSDSGCIGSPITSTNTSTGSNLSYSWNMGDGTFYSTLDITHTYLTDGTYTVTLIIEDTLHNCIDTATQIIYIENNASAKFVVSPTLTCIGQQVYIKDSFNKNVLTYFYDLGNGDTIYNTRNPVISYVQSGDYNITLHSTYPICPDQSTTESIHVDKYPEVNLGSPETICTGRETIEIKDDNNPLATYVWNTGATTSSIIVQYPGTYEVVVSYGECETKATKVIIPDLDCIFIPTAFSPNGDIYNDYFKPIWYNENDITAYRMIIYNRFGQQLYTSEDKNGKGWDGNYRGEACPISTYMYFISIVGSGGQTKSFKGDVTLIR